MPASVRDSSSSTSSPSPRSATVSVPGYVELRLDVPAAKGGAGDAVVVFTVMDGAAVRITEGATWAGRLGGRRAQVRHTLGFDRTEAPTPGAFRVQATGTASGTRVLDQVWNVTVDSTAAKRVLTALAEVADAGMPYLEIPDEEELEGLTMLAERKASRRRAAKKGAATRRRAATKKTTAKKTATKKTATKKTAVKKSTAKKAATKSSGARKTTAKKAASKKSATKKTTRRSTAKKAPVRKAAAKRSTAKKSAAKRSTTKKSAAKKRSSRR